MKLYKLLIICVVLITSVLLSGCNLKQNTEKSGTTNSPEINEDQKELNSKWEDLKNSDKFKQCLQSKRDFDNKKTEILPLYKAVLNKEIASQKINFEDEYIKYLHDVFEIEKEYLIFEEIQNSQNPGNEERLEKIKNLLEYIYCPDVNKITFDYPLTTEGCIEILSVLKSNDRIISIPESSNYQIKEEYLLAVQKLKEGVSFDKKTARECCISKERSASCTKLVYFLEGNNY